MEEFPLLLSNVGMAHKAPSYFVPVLPSTSYEGPPFSAFDTTPTILNAAAPVPGLFNQQVRLKPGQGLAVIESSLVRAPLARHKPRGTDFLLLRGRYASAKVEEWRLRPIQRICVVGQTEPLQEICGPSSRSSAMKRRVCVRQMVRQVRHRHGYRHDDTNEENEWDLDAIQRWWPSLHADIVKRECRDS